jgi:tetratricopeptide (TPR) repeat protein
MSLVTLAKNQMQVARLIGRQDFDGVIRVLEESLSNSANDVPDLEMMALCHRWCQRNDMAIGSAQKVLTYDPKHFGAIRLLSEIYAEREDYETAAKFARLGLDNYPAPFPRIPKVFFWILRIGAVLFPRLKRIDESAKRDLTDLNKEDNEWYFWAKQYLSWYDSVNRGKHTPTMH